MPITHVARSRETIPADAENVREVNGFWRYDLYAGRVLDVYERNGYDDSDFVAIVWMGEEEGAVHVEYGSTAYYSTSSASVDATEEVKAAYEAWREEQARREREAKEQDLADAGLTLEDYAKLRQSLGTAATPSVVKLLRSEHHGRLRSSFRRSIAAQIRAWLRGESSYRDPLSPRQFDALLAHDRDYWRRVRYGQEAN